MPHDYDYLIHPFFAISGLLKTNPLFLEYLNRYGLKADRIVEEVLEKGRFKDVGHILLTATGPIAASPLQI